MVVFSTTHAQDLKIGLAFGYVATLDGGNGATLHLEPSYDLNSSFAIGLRAEASVLSKLVDGYETYPNGAESSITLNAQYFINKEDCRFIFGLGTGLYRQASISHPVAGYDLIAADLNIGAYPRIGIAYNRFNLLAEYNFIPKTNDRITLNELTVGQPRLVVVNNSYFTIKAGVLIGKSKI